MGIILIPFLSHFKYTTMKQFGRPQPTEPTPPVEAPVIPITQPVEKPTENPAA